MRAKDADRVAARRAAAEHEVAAQRVRKDSEARRATIDRLADQARSLIPTVLTTLANDDYRGVEQIEVYVPRRGPGRIFEND